MEDNGIPFERVFREGGDSVEWAESGEAPPGPVKGSEDGRRLLAAAGLSLQEEDTLGFVQIRLSDVEEGDAASVHLASAIDDNHLHIFVKALVQTALALTERMKVAGS